MVFSSLALLFGFLFPFAKNINTLITRPDIESSIRGKINSEYERIVSTGADNPKIIYYSP